MTASFQILAYEETPLGPLCLRSRQILGKQGTSVTEIALNHELLMSSHHTASERALAKLAIAIHGGSDLKVLVGGAKAPTPAFSSTWAHLIVSGLP